MKTLIIVAVMSIPLAVTAQKPTLVNHPHKVICPTGTHEGHDSTGQPVCVPN